MPDALRVFVSVAEDSADIHAASLVRCARERLPASEFYGLTGPRLRALGVSTLVDLAAHAAMLSGAVGLIGRAWKALRAVEADWRQRRPDVVILLDSPELHLPMARRARRLGIPVLYYIAPQTWASRAGRNRRIARDVSRLACILPFEEAYFRGAGVHAEYVGHPLFETLQREAPNAERVANLKTSPANPTPLMALLPGSRRQVIHAVLPLQLSVARRLADGGVPVRLAISAVDAERAALIRALVERFGLSAQILVADNASLLTAADLVLVASGTATLHVAHYRKPMIVLYDAGLLGRLYRPFGKLVVTTPNLSLVNILAGARVVPEFMPVAPDPAAVAAVAKDLLTDEGWRRLMIEQLDEVVRPLESTAPSVRLCEIIQELVGSSRR